MASLNHRLWHWLVLGVLAFGGFGASFALGQWVASGPGMKQSKSFV